MTRKYSVVSSSILRTTLLSLLAAFVFCIPLTFSQTAEQLVYLEQFRGRVLIGMELELSDRPLRIIINQFDFHRYQEEHPEVMDLLPTEIVDSYLEDPANLDHLIDPDGSLRAYLVEGLNYNLSLPRALGFNPGEALIVRAGVPREPNESRQSAVIQGRGIQSARRIQNDETTITGGPVILSQPTSTQNVRPSPVNSAPSPEIPENFRAQSDWSRLLRRWRELSPEIRRSAMRLERLTPHQRVNLVLPETHKVKPVVIAKNLHIRKDLPAEVQDLYRVLGWTIDRNVLEFTHVIPTDDPILYLKQLNALARLAGIEGHLNHPLIANRNARLRTDMPGYHYHVSMNGMPVYQQMYFMNYTHLFEAADLGINPFDQSTNVVFHDELFIRGNMRQIEAEPDHGEFRDQLTDPATALVTTLSRLESFEQAETDLRLALLEGNPLHKDPTTMTINDLIILNLRSPKAMRRRAAIMALSGQRLIRSDEVRPDLVRLLDDEDVEIRRKAIAILSLCRDEPHEISAFLRRTTDPDVSIRSYAFSAFFGFRRSVDWTKLREKLIVGLHDKDVSIRRQVIKRFAFHMHDTELHDAYVALLQDPEVQRDAAVALDNPHNPHRESDMRLVSAMLETLENDPAAPIDCPAASLEAQLATGLR